MQTSSVVSIREKHLETRLKAGGVAVLEETDYSQLAGWTLSLSTQAHCSPQRGESPCVKQHSPAYLAQSDQVLMNMSSFSISEYRISQQNMARG